MPTITKLTARALDDVALERIHQDEKWGAHRVQDLAVWQLIISEELGEAAEAILEWRAAFREGLPTVARRELANLREELVQVAASAVATIEAIDARRFPAPTAQPPDRSRGEP